MFAWKTHCGLKVHFSQIEQSEICTEVSFTLPEPMWMQTMKLTYTEAKFYSKVKSQTGLSLLQVSWNMLLVITVFHNFYRVTCNVHFETTSFPDFICDCNEKFSAEWVSFWTNFRKKTIVSFKSLLSLFPFSKVIQNCVSIYVEWI